MLVTKKISPTEFRLSVNVLNLFKIRKDNYNYLLNLHFYLYQLSYYLYRKYNLYIHPSKFFLLDSYEVVYAFFLFFNKFELLVDDFYLSAFTKSVKIIKPEIFFNYICMKTNRNYAKRVNLIQIYKKKIGRKLNFKKKYNFLLKTKFSRMKFKNSFLLTFLEKKKFEQILEKKKKIPYYVFRYPHLRKKKAFLKKKKNKKHYSKKKSFKYLFLKKKNKKKLFLKNKHKRKFDQNKKKIFLRNKKKKKSFKYLFLKKKNKKKLFLKKIKKLLKRHKRDFFFAGKFKVLTKIFKKKLYRYLTRREKNSVKLLNERKLKRKYKNSGMRKIRKKKFFRKLKNKFYWRFIFLNKKKLFNQKCKKKYKKNFFLVLVKNNNRLFKLNLFNFPPDTTEKVEKKEIFVIKKKTFIKSSFYQFLFFYKRLLTTKDFLLKILRGERLLRETLWRKWRIYYRKPRSRFFRGRFYYVPRNYSKSRRVEKLIFEPQGTRKVRYRSKVFYKKRIYLLKKQCWRKFFRLTRSYRFKLRNSNYFLYNRCKIFKKFIFFNKYQFFKLFSFKPMLLYTYSRRKIQLFKKNKLFFKNSVVKKKKTFFENSILENLFFKILKIKLKNKQENIDPIPIKKTFSKIFYNTQRFKKKLFQTKQKKFFILKREFHDVFAIKTKFIQKLKYFYKLFLKNFYNIDVNFYLVPFNYILFLNENLKKEFFIIYKRASTLRFLKKKKQPMSIFLFNLFFLSFYYKNFFLLLRYCKNYIMKQKRQKMVLLTLINIYKVFYYYKKNYIKCLKFLFHGTFDRHGRTRKFVYLLGKFKISSFNLPILFDWIDFASKYGSISLKIWIIYHKALKNL